MIEIPNLTIDRDGDGPDVQVMLTQDFGGNEHMVTLHPCQVRVLAERMGLLAPDVDAQRTIARLSRQLRVLLERIDTLDDWLNQASQRGHEDLSMEAIYSYATWEMAREFVADLPAENTLDGITCDKGRDMSWETAVTSSDVAGGFPPKTGITSVQPELALTGGSEA